MRSLRYWRPRCFPSARPRNLSSLSGRQSRTSHGTAERGVASAQSQPRVATSARITTRRSIQRRVISLQSSLSACAVPRHYHSSSPSLPLDGHTAHARLCPTCGFNCEGPRVSPGRTQPSRPLYPALEFFRRFSLLLTSMATLCMFLRASFVGARSHYRNTYTVPLHAASFIPRRSWRRQTTDPKGSLACLLISDCGRVFCILPILVSRVFAKPRATAARDATDSHDITTFTSGSTRAPPHTPTPFFR
jgi:hypothetical protein